ncbi:MAG: hypothetical protein ACOX4G_15465 [Limnochordia bacterium]
MTTLILDEQLRIKIDAVSQRLRNADQLTATIRALVASLIGFVSLRSLTGLLTGGQGALTSALMALAAGVTHILSRQRSRHTRLSAARFIDLELSLQDRLATAVECASLDTKASSRVEQWLFVDAAQQAPFIKPEELVPYHPPHEARWLLPLLIVAVVLSLPIYPSGLSWQIGGGELQEAAKRADELAALADQLERLAQQQPELREVTDLLRTMAQQLRDKRLPKSEALRLLKELEQEMQVTADAQSVDLDLTHIQNLAQRLRRITSSEIRGRESIGQWLSQGSDKGRAPSDTEYGNRTDGMPGDAQTESTPGSRQSTKADANTTAGGPSSSPSSREKPADPTGGGSTDSHDYAGDDDSYMHGSSAGTGRGDSQRQEPFQPSTNLTRELTPISGKLGESGSILTGQAEGTTAPTQPAVPRTGGRAPVITPAGIEQAVTQERIPLAYRHWIKRYFETIEPGQSP